MRAQAAMAKPALATTDVAILAGGLGTRVAHRLDGLPKIMAPAGSRPFLDHLLDWLERQGARRVALCLGHRAEPVLTHLAKAPRPKLDIVPVVEPEPRGTAGAIAFARSALQSDPVLVMNGDTVFAADLSAFLTAFRRSGAEAGLVVTVVEDPARYGRVEFDRAGRITRFREKEDRDRSPGWISTGLYLFAGRFLNRIASMERGSLERDVLQLLPPGSIHAFRAAGRFLDIGTPETLDRAEDFVGALNEPGPHR